MSDLLRHACSFLFVPASRPERLHKALASSADMVIADLEDAVAPGDKASARTALAALVPTLDAAQRTRLLVRINAAGTAWVDDDVHTVATLVSRGLAGAVVPKAESPEYLNQLAQQTGTGCALVALIETVAGMDALPALARAAQVQRLALGIWIFRWMRACNARPTKASCCLPAWPWSWHRAVQACPRPLTESRWTPRTPHACTATPHARCAWVLAASYASTPHSWKAYTPYLPPMP